MKEIPTKSITIRASEGRVNQVKVNHDGDLIFTCGTDAELSVWDANTGERLGTYPFHAEAMYDPEMCLQRSLASNRRAMNFLNVNRHSTEIVVSRVNDLIIWDVETGRVLDFIQMPTTVGDIEYNQSILGSDKLLVVITARLNTETITSPRIHLYTCANLKPDFYGTAPRGWKLEREFIGLNSRPTFVRWGPLDSFIICGTEEGEIVVWDLDGTIKMRIMAHSSEIKDVSFNADRSLMLSVARDKKAILWNTARMEIIREYISDRPLNACAISPAVDFESNKVCYQVLLAGGQDPKDVTTSGSDQGFFETIILDLVTGHEAGRITAHYSPTLCLSYMRDGKRFVTGTYEGNCKIISLPDRFFTEMLTN